MNVLYSKNARFRILAHFILLAISMLLSGQVFAQAFADGDLTYSTVGVPAGQVKVTGCAADPCATSDIEIPVTATGATTYSVTRIKENAFPRRNIASVTIPSTITVIEYSAFEENALASLIIPDSVTAIGNGAFFSNVIRSLILPATVTALGQGVFEENELTSLTIQEGVESIPASTFAGNNLAIVTIPSSVTTIGVSAFEQNKLTLVAFKGNRGSFDGQTFGNNVNLARITYCEGASGWPGTPFNRGIPNTSTDTVTPVAVSCVDNQYTVGGLLSGLVAGDTVVLQNNNGDDLPLTADGAFTFATAVGSGDAYAVAILSQSGGLSETCIVSNGSGTIGASNVDNVSVICALDSFTVGGSVSGLATGESVVLQNNGADSQTQSTNGNFVFSKQADGSSYAVTIATQPASQTCSVNDGSGSLAGADVSKVLVSCVNVLPPTTIAQVPTSPLWLLGIMAGLLSVLGIRKLPQA